jgi:hypothetical protein
MSDIDITLSLPEELVEKARAQGVLNNQRIALLIQAEIERMEGWRRLDQTLEPVREAFRADHEGMTEDEIMAMINDTVHEVRAERRAARDQEDNEGQSES